MESKRQKQIARLVQENLSAILQKEGLSVFNNAMITITQVKITPDMLISRVYLSIYNSKEREKILEAFREYIPHLRHKLGNRLKNKLKHIPELEFYLDERLDEAYRIEELLKRTRGKKGE